MSNDYNKYKKYKTKYLNLKTQQGGSDSLLGYAVFTVPLKLQNITDPTQFAPGEHQRFWNPTSAILIYGKKDAVLVDTLMTIEDATNLTNWIEMSGKNLIAIYITHGHGDHFLGANIILKRFPHTQILATKGVIERMHQQTEAGSSLETLFPGQIPHTPPMPTELRDNEFYLEGHKLIAIETHHTDTDNTTVLYVPDIGLIVAGDVVYNNVNLHLADSPSKEQRNQWIAALDKIEKLNPQTVIASHKWSGNEDHPRNINETRQYIKDFSKLVDETTTAKELYDKMILFYPHRINRGTLWASAMSAKQIKIHHE
ncbi:MAG: MBL fold metallo-hydrolase [Terrestrivirus sp.]|uniref:MBL fold metallo-hydrolase n=1 Tax=Terrestrivirus sp. TaxID=2487775 RepID=A0A3G4ZQ58_9VIRU|nr:MAG: MBL fold metallo-hydrolase [Terrestrivirus sp.]